MDETLPVFRLNGTSTLTQARQRVREAIERARDSGARGLLIDARDAGGFLPPDLAARHEMVRDWAIAAGGKLLLALVVRPEFIDPERFGVVSARNFGLVGNVFESETEAAQWLREAIAGG